MSEPVRAAGGVVWRRRPDGEAEVLVIHRPKYDDWTFPKGKLEPGETHEQAARREVAEETSLECVLGDELASTSYVDNQGRPKTVRYWTMRAIAGEFTPNREVDEVTWLDRAGAAARLTHDHDRDVLAVWTPGP